MPAPKSPSKAPAGRADFLNASKSAAIAETHRKEERCVVGGGRRAPAVAARLRPRAASAVPSPYHLCHPLHTHPPHRVLHKMLQTQIELGRIKLPAEADAAPADAAPTAEEAAEHERRVRRHTEWLLAAHRGAAPSTAPSVAQVETASAGSTAEPAAPAPAREAEGQGAAQPSAAADAASEAAEAAAKAEAEVHIRDQLRDISRALWGAVSAGAASGQPGGASRTRSDFAFQPEAVDTMWREGELDARHRRRRDEHAAYVEAAARDVALRRGAGAAGKPAK